MGSHLTVLCEFNIFNDRVCTSKIVTIWGLNRHTDSRRFNHWSRRPSHPLRTKPLSKVKDYPTQTFSFNLHHQRKRRTNSTWASPPLHSVTHLPSVPYTPSTSIQSAPSTFANPFKMTDLNDQVYKYKIPSWPFKASKSSKTLSHQILNWKGKITSLISLNTWISPCWTARIFCKSMHVTIQSSIGSTPKENATWLKWRLSRLKFSKISNSWSPAARCREGQQRLPEQDGKWDQRCWFWLQLLLTLVYLQTIISLSRLQ